MTDHRGTDPRASDELTLRIIKLRCDGYTPAMIGRRIGRSQQYVSTATVRVCRADRQESGEPRDAVMAAYW